MARKSIFALLAVIVCAWALQASPSAAMTIGGVVRLPLNLSTEDLARFESATVRLNELTRDNQFRGVFTYRGVPLRTLLELAFVQKEESSFGKSLDLAVVIRNREGKRTVLSWGRRQWGRIRTPFPWRAFSLSGRGKDHDCRRDQGPSL